MPTDLSALRRKAFTYTVPVFGHIHPQNPLRELDDRGRIYVWGLLTGFAFFTIPERRGKAADHPLERISQFLADATKLGSELESHVFNGSFSGALAPLTAGYEDLPNRLFDFSARVGGFIDSLGKRGHKNKAFAAQFLVEASEFVRLQTGRYYDEHLAELFQAAAEPLSDLTQTSIRPRATEDLSGDAIRKKRKYWKKHYPELYAAALGRAKKACQQLAPRREQL